jgi:hypothetical protein
MDHSVSPSHTLVCEAELWTLIFRVCILGPLPLSRNRKNQATGGIVRGDDKRSGEIIKSLSSSAEIWRAYLASSHYFIKSPCEAFRNPSLHFNFWPLFLFVFQMWAISLDGNATMFHLSSSRKRTMSGHAIGHRTNSQQSFEDPRRPLRGPSGVSDM